MRDHDPVAFHSSSSSTTSISKPYFETLCSGKVKTL